MDDPYPEFSQSYDCAFTKIVNISILLRKWGVYAPPFIQHEQMQINIGLYLQKVRFSTKFGKILQIIALWMVMI